MIHCRRSIGDTKFRANYAFCVYSCAYKWLKILSGSWKSQRDETGLMSNVCTTLLSTFTFILTIRQSGITLWPLAGEVSDSDRLSLSVDTRDIWGDKGKFCPQSLHVKSSKVGQEWGWVDGWVKDDSVLNVPIQSPHWENVCQSTYYVCSVVEPEWQCITVITRNSVFVF